ncbi:MAG: hypothetical protein R3E95_19455 [Thiolinea sp.]
MAISLSASGSACSGFCSSTTIVGVFTQLQATDQMIQFQGVSRTKRDHVQGICHAEAFGANLPSTVPEAVSRFTSAPGGEQRIKRRDRRIAVGGNRDAELLGGVNGSRRSVRS